VQKNPVVAHVNKILIGAILWSIFYMRLYFNETDWNETLFGTTFPNLYQPLIRYGLQLIFFLILNLNLFHYTVGKRHAVLDYPRFFKVFIFIALTVFITQTVSIYLNIPFHFGLIGYFFGSGDYALFVRELPVYTYIVYMFSQMMMILYLAGVVIYLFQVLKMKLTLGFAYGLRYMMILGLYAFALGFTPVGFDLYHMILMIVYVFVAFLVYMRTTYSLRALLLAVILLFIL
jgi:hypothetical protein